MLTYWHGGGHAHDNMFLLKRFSMRCRHRSKKIKTELAELVFVVVWIKDQYDKNRFTTAEQTCALKKRMFMN